MPRGFAMCLAFILYSNASLACIPHYPQYPTDGHEIIEVKVGDTYFRFPETFFYFSEDRLPIERDYIRIRVTDPDFKALPLAKDIRSMESSEWAQQHPSLAINIRENDTYVRGYSNDTPKYVLTSKTEIQYWGSKILTPDGIREKLKPYMFTKPSDDWAANQQLAEALHIHKEHSGVDPCSAFNRRPGEKVAAPPPLALVPMDIIEKGLKHKSQAIRQTAVGQLARYEDATERLKQIAINDNAYVVRLTALNQLSTRETFKPAAPFFVERFQAESNSVIIGQLGDILRRSKENVTDLLIDGVAQEKEPKLSEAMEIIAWSINQEVRENKLTRYEQLSPQSKKALEAVMDYYERSDASQDRKERIRNALRNSKATIATPRYIDLMIQQGAIAELGDMVSEPKKVVPYLMAELKSNRVGNYPYVTEALGKFGAAAKPALPLLLPLLAFNCPEALGPNGEQIVQIGAPMDIKDPTKCQPFMVNYTRQVTANAISQIGIASPEVLETLYAALNDKETVYSAGSALVLLESDQDKLMKTLLNLLRTLNQENGQGWIIRIFEEMGPKAKPAIVDLRKIMEENSNQFLRNDAHQALEKITGEKLPSPKQPEQHAPASLQNSEKAVSVPAPPPPVVAPPGPVPTSMPTTATKKDDAKLLSAQGPLDTSTASHRAFEKKWEGKTNRKSGEFARYGTWDSGECYGSDDWACGEWTSHKTGCEREFPACSSGTAIASESYAGDGICVFTWWKWVCK